MVHKTCPDCSGTLPVASKQCPCGYIFSAKKIPTKATERKVEITSSRLRPERVKKSYTVQKGVEATSATKRTTTKGEGDKYDSGEDELADDSREAHGGDDDSPTYRPDREKGNSRPRRELRSGGKENGGKESNPSENVSLREDPNTVKNSAENQTEDVCDDQSAAPRRPRGRPKGSKDKKPRQPKGYRDMGLPTLSAKYGPHMDDKGRSVDGMKAKRQRLDYPHDNDDRYLQPWQIDLKEEYILDYDASTDIHMNMSSEKREVFKLILEDINSKISRQNFKPD